jgi:hypothetical protein
VGLIPRDRDRAGRRRLDCIPQPGGRRVAPPLVKPDAYVNGMSMRSSNPTNSGTPQFRLIGTATNLAGALSSPLRFVISPACCGLIMLEGISKDAARAGTES